MTNQREEIKAGQEFFFLGAITAIEQTAALLTFASGIVKLSFTGEELYQVLSHRALEQGIFAVCITKSGLVPEGELIKVIYPTSETVAIN